MAREASNQSQDKPDCRQTVAMIPAFLSDTLNERDLQHFLQHVRTCRHCYEELETNFMVDRTLLYLDKDMPADTSFDLTPLLENELQERTKRLRRDGDIRTLRFLILLSTIVLIVLFFLDMTGLFQITVFMGV